MTSPPSPLALPFKFGPNQHTKEKQCLLCKCSLSNNNGYNVLRVFTEVWLYVRYQSAFSVLTNFSYSTGSIVILIFTLKETENRVVVLKHVI